VCDVEGIGVPSIFKTIRSNTVTPDLEENGETLFIMKCEKRELNRIRTYECRCDERIYTSLIH
jgi:hypothetical protein